MTAEKSTPGVLVLFNECLPLIKGEPNDILTEEGVADCAKAVKEVLSKHYDVVEVPLHTDVELAIAPFPPSRWVVFNLGEGLKGRLFEEARIVWVLEAMGYCYTGSGGDALVHTTHKGLTKQRLEAAGVATPPGWIFRSASEACTVQENTAFHFPLIVKPVAEDASLGIGCKAVVHDLASLQERVDYITQAYHQAALVEQFIAGREFTISMWGDPPQVLPFNEIQFGGFPSQSDHIVSFSAKWEPESNDYRNTPVICPAQVPDELAQRLRETALKAWEVLGCKGYARMDLRVDETGQPFVLEVNCNPDLSPEAGFSLSAHAAGYSYEEMVLKILHLALERFDS